MADILDTIIAHKRVEVEKREQAVPVTRLLDTCRNLSPCIGMKESLAASPSGIIAEFKRRSPSKGWINEEADVRKVAAAYSAHGAAAMSILTDEAFFGGRLADLECARREVRLPLLRKDFMISEYQIVEARAAGADAVLLIAAALSIEKCRSLATLAHELGLQTLLEIHSEQELDYASDGIDMVGVNNRNLGTFHTDVGNSFRLAAQLPADKLLVSESGISHPEIAGQLRAEGFRGFLIGEAFMATEDPGAALVHFIKSLES